jgi:hypothetical protein
VVELVETEAAGAPVVELVETSAAMPHTSQ